MSNNNSNNFQTPEEPKEEPLKFKLLPFGVEHPPNPHRPFYMVESSNPIFPTLTNTEPINLFPFYVSTGTNFSREQSNKLSVFSGISFVYRENNGESFIDLLNTFPLLKKLVLDYIDSKGGNKEKKPIEELCLNNMFLNYWFIKLKSSYQYNTKTATGQAVESYDKKWPGQKQVYQFLGAETCVEEIKTAIQRAPSYEEAKEYNKNVSRFTRYGGVLQTKHHDMYNEGIRNRVGQQESTYVVRYCANPLLHSLRNANFKIRPDFKTKLSKYQVNKHIGENNLFGKYLNQTNLREDTVDTGFDMKYKRILNFVLMNIYFCNFGNMVEKKIFSINFNTIMGDRNFINLKSRTFLNDLFEIKKKTQNTYCNETEFKQIIEDAFILLEKTYSRSEIKSILKIFEVKDFVEKTIEELYVEIKSLFPKEKEQNIKLFIDDLIYNVNGSFKIIEVETSKFNDLLNKCEEIFEEIVSPEGNLNIDLAAKYEEGTDILDFIALPIYDLLKKCPTEIAVKSKKKKTSTKRQTKKPQKKKSSEKKRKYSKKGTRTKP